MGPCASISLSLHPQSARDRAVDITHNVEAVVLVRVGAFRDHRTLHVLSGLTAPVRVRKVASLRVLDRVQRGPLSDLGPIPRTMGWSVLTGELDYFHPDQHLSFASWRNLQLEHRGKIEATRRSRARSLL